MPRGVYKLRKCSKETRCTERSYHTINKGDTYLFSSMPPEHEMNQSKRWVTIKACIRCAKEFGLLNSDMENELEAK